MATLLNQRDIESDDNNHNSDNNYLFNVCICGGGNGAHTTAAYIGSKGNIHTSILSRQAHRWKSKVKLVTGASSWAYKGDIEGQINRISSRPEDVIPKADIIIVAAPANAHYSILKNIQPYVKKKAIIGTLFAQGGFDWIIKSVFKEKINDLDLVFGLQNIPWLCRIIVYGELVKLLGPKKLLHVAAMPPSKAHTASKLISLLFDIQAITIANFLSMTLTPSNQIIHPARIYGIFKQWDGINPLSGNDIQFGLYNEMDDFSADIMQRLDNELQSIKNELSLRYPSLDLSNVLPLCNRIIRQYGDDVLDKSSLRNIFRSNKGYNGCRTPVVEVGPDKYIPSISSRLFWEDIPHGLCILKDFSQRLDLKTPTIDDMIRWHQKFMGIEFIDPQGTLNISCIDKTTAPTAFGLLSLDDIVSSSIQDDNCKNTIEVHHFRSKY